MLDLVPSLYGRKEWIWHLMGNVQMYTLFRGMETQAISQVQRRVQRRRIESKK